MFQLGKLAIQSTVSTLGTVAIAAQAMTNILENLNGIAAIGVGVGLMTIVGQCLGAGSKTTGLDDGIYSGLWTEGGGGCEVLHDYFLCDHVVLQILPLCAFDPCLWIRPDGSLDRNVCRLDTSRHHFQPQIPQQEMAGTSGDLKKNWLFCEKPWCTLAYCLGFSFIR